MLFVVGLGNPGAEYHGTRHNVGFEVVERLAERHGFPTSKRFKNAEVSRGRIAGHDALLIEPMTYMNLSGDAVGSIVQYYRGEPEDVIVVHDELDFEPGVVRLKKGGGHGGHNGLRSIAGQIGRDFVRVRVGVGKPPRGQGVDHVLSRFTAEERRLTNEAVDQAADAVEMILERGLQRAMNAFNQKPPKEGEDTGNDDSHQP